jgi:DNA-binding transcriptional ArsR family regulator
MRTTTPPLLPIFRSRGQARILARIFVDEAKPVAIRALARELGLAPSRVHDEVRRLEDAGLIVSQRVGNQRLIRPNPRSAFYPELRALLLKAFGPVRVLEPLLARIDGIEDAFIYGSWARRYRGEPGPPPEDIDLMVIGQPPVDDVYAAADIASRELGREVSVTVLSPIEWRGSSGFAESVRAGPTVPVIVDGDGRDTR